VCIKSLWQCISELIIECHCISAEESTEESKEEKRSLKKSPGVIEE